MKSIDNIVLLTLSSKTLADRTLNGITNGRSQSWPLAWFDALTETFDALPEVGCPQGGEDPYGGVVTLDFTRGRYRSLCALGGLTLRVIPFLEIVAMGRNILRMELLHTLTCSLQDPPSVTRHPHNTTRSSNAPGIRTKETDMSTTDKDEVIVINITLPSDPSKTVADANPERLTCEARTRKVINELFKQAPKRRVQEKGKSSS